MSETINMVRNNSGHYSMPSSSHAGLAWFSQIGRQLEMYRERETARHARRMGLLPKSFAKPRTFGRRGTKPAVRFFESPRYTPDALFKQAPRLLGLHPAAMRRFAAQYGMQLAQDMVRETFLEWADPAELWKPDFMLPLPDKPVRPVDVFYPGNGWKISFGCVPWEEMLKNVMCSPTRPKYEPYKMAYGPAVGGSACGSYPDSTINAAQNHYGTTEARLLANSYLGTGCPLQSLHPTLLKYTRSLADANAGPLPPARYVPWMPMPEQFDNRLPLQRYRMWSPDLNLPDMPPQSHPEPVPWALIPKRNRVRRPGTLSPGVVVDTNGGKSRLPPHRPVKPAPGEKERKFKDVAGTPFALKLLRAAQKYAFHPTTEAADVVDAVYDALPPELQTCRKSDLVCMGQQIYENFDKLNVEKALYNLAMNHLEDKVIGQGFKGLQDASKRLGIPGPYKFYQPTLR